MRLRLCSLIEEGGDWDRRNRLKVYQGLYCVAIRDFKQAAELFLDTVSTFTSYELMDYKTFVTYTVYVCMIALKRPDLREKVGDLSVCTRERVLRKFVHLCICELSVSSEKGGEFDCFITIYSMYSGFVKCLHPGYGW